jgi:hypothetical protein
MTVLARLMKTLRLSVVIVASALSLASANAMPDLGRETGKFIRPDEPTPEGVRNFQAIEKKDSGSGLGSLKPIWTPTHGARLSMGVPLRPPGAKLSMGVPLRPPGASLAMGVPLRPPGASLAMGVPLRPPGVSLAMGVPLRPPGASLAMGVPLRPPGASPRWGFLSDHPERY